MLGENWFGPRSFGLRGFIGVNVSGSRDQKAFPLQ
jgi:hypothetical protein